MRSKLEPFKTFVGMLRSHLDGILAWTKTRLSNQVDQSPVLRIPQRREFHRGHLSLVRPAAAAAMVRTAGGHAYFDLNMRHFHEKFREEHGIELSYTFVQQKALQGAGLVARGRKRRKHRRRREQRLMPMLPHIDGSKHQWFGDERRYDLIVILDDATSDERVHLRGCPVDHFRKTEVEWEANSS
jgi:hypothetical protein